VLARGVIHVCHQLSSPEKKGPGKQSREKKSGRPELSFLNNNRTASNDQGCKNKPQIGINRNYLVDAGDDTVPLTR